MNFRLGVRDLVSGGERFIFQETYLVIIFVALGKSTLALSLLRVIEPSEGRIMYVSRSSNPNYSTNF